MVISYVGKERCDLLYYVTTLGQRAGKEILVIDNSVTHDFFNLYEKIDHEDIVESDFITVCKDYCMDEQLKEEYDYIFIYEGISKMHSYKGPRDTTIVAVSMEDTELRNIKNAIRDYDENAKLNPVLIIRDCVNNKINVADIAEKLHINPEVMFRIGFDQRDYAMYINLSHNKIGKFRGMSPEMEDAVSCIGEFLYQLDSKTVKRIMR